MSDIFDGADPILIAKKWLKEAEITEINDANAMALASVDQEGCSKCQDGVAEGNREQCIHFLYQL